MQGILVVALGATGPWDRGQGYAIHPTMHGKVFTQCQQCLDGESLPYPGIHIRFSSEIPLLPWNPLRTTLFSPFFELHYMFGMKPCTALHCSLEFVCGYFIFLIECEVSWQQELISSSFRAFNCTKPGSLHLAFPQYIPDKWAYLQWMIESWSLKLIHWDNGKDYPRNLERGKTKQNKKMLIEI